MLFFKSFLIESFESEKLKHLEHAEDHPINAGAAGFNHAVATLKGVHNALQGKKSDVKLTTKYDGAPSIVFGYHPENNKFFVGTKSIFNKNPKVNYTPQDIEKNHGHAPGLVDKLKTALNHLPKVTPKGGVYQGDVMHSQEDVKQSGDSYHTTPNTITYSAKKESVQGKKMAAAQIGVAVHTKYHGDSLDNMKAKYGPSTKEFAHHKDVNIISTESKPNPADYTPEHRKQFESSIAKAEKLHAGHDYSHLNNHDHVTHLKTYINSTVREGTKPSVNGFIKHVAAKHVASEGKYKTAAGRQKISEKSRNAIADIQSNKKAFQTTLQIHKHLQDAKHALVNGLKNEGEFSHSINGKESGPEGHVAIINNMPTKLVDRSSEGFAATNLRAGGIKAIKKTK